MAQKLLELKGETFEISYELTHRDRSFNTLFLHGWGANKEMMKQSFNEAFVDCKALYLDLPGFGKSSAPSAYDSFEAKDVVQKFLEEMEFTPNMILSHSFGGKIATLLKPNYLVLLSSAGIPTPKPLKVKAKIATVKLLKNIAPNPLLKAFRSKDVDSMSEVMYETFKRVVDEDFSEIFRAYDKEAYIFWGTEDSATPLSCGERIKELIKGSKFYPLEGDHFFFLRKGDIIRQKLGESIEDLRSLA